MEAVLLVIHLIVALGIIIMVLVQPSESGGFLGSGGSMSNMMAPRRKGDVLTRTTGILAAGFFITSLSLAFLASQRPHESNSILDAADAGAAPVATGKVIEEGAVAPVAEGEVEQSTPVPAAEEPAPAAEPEAPKAPIAP